MSGADTRQRSQDADIIAPDPAAIDLLVVASWYPSIEETTSGRFVADQVEAVAATGRAAPRVLSFDPVRVGGLEPEITRATAAARDAARQALAQRSLIWHATGWSTPPIPVARLPAADAGSHVDGPLHAVAARRAALESASAWHARGPRVIVHAHGIYPDGVAAAELAARLNAPLIITEHASFLAETLADPARRAAAHEAVERAAVTIAVGQDLADEIRLLAPDAAARVRAIPNAVPMDHLRVTPREERRAGELLYLGYRTDKKGIEPLLRSFALARASRPDLTLRLVGRSPTIELEARWLALARALGVADAVIFDPPALRRGVADALMSADVLVHPSRMETFGIAVVEALATGMPIVATATNGVRETVIGSPSDVGALVPIDDVEAISAGILDVLARRDSFVPERLRAGVEGRFGAPQVAARLVRLYEEILAGASSSSDPASSISLADRPADVGALADVDDAAASGDRVVLVGLDAGRAAALLRQLPEPALRRIALVTGAGRASERLPIALGSVVRVDVDERYRAIIGARRSPGGPGILPRAARFLLDPGGPVRRRRARARRVMLRVEAARGPVGALLAQSRDRPQLVVCLAGLDHLVMEPLFASGAAQPAPGGIRWLADDIAASPRKVRPVANVDPTRPIRVALYSAADLNVIDGSAIWLESTCVMLARVPGVDVTVIQHAPDVRPFITDRLRASPGIRLVRPSWPLADPRAKLTPGEAVDFIEELDAVAPFDIIIVRGSSACSRAVERAAIRPHLWSAYVLEPERDLTSPAYIAELARIVESSARVIVQSGRMGALFSRHIPAVEEKLLSLPPGVPPEEIAPHAAARRPRLLYAGKFHPFYAVETLIAEFATLRREHPELEFHVAGDKFMSVAGDPDFADRTRHLLRTTPGITWHGGIDRGSVGALLRVGGVALSVWDRGHGAEMNDLVVSTKLLDYCAAGVPIVLTRTEMQAELLGNDYPLFVDEPSEVTAVLRRLLADPATWQAATERALDVARRYSYDRIAAAVAPAITAAHAATIRHSPADPPEQPLVEDS